MVDADTKRAATGIGNNLMQRDLVGLVEYGGVTFLGMLAAQELADNVLPMVPGIGVPANPTSGADLGAHALFKVVGAAATAFAANNYGSGDMLTTYGNLAAGGMLVSAAMDSVDMLQSAGLPGLAPSTSSAPTPVKSSGSAQVKRAKPARAASSMGVQSHIR